MTTERRSVPLSLNGSPARLEVEPRTTLAQAIRDLGLTGTKLGCEQGVCGSCTVLFQGEQIRSCLMFAVQAQDAQIWTIEGLTSEASNVDAPESPLPGVHRLARAFREHHAIQCGFCTPGMLIAGACIGRDEPEMCERTVREGLSGNVCRCTGYQGIVDAILETYGAPSGTGE